MKPLLKAVTPDTTPESLFSHKPQTTRKKEERLFKEMKLSWTKQAEEICSDILQQMQRISIIFAILGNVYK